MRAWATMFEEFLSSRGVEAPYTEADYFEYVDGRPRYDGVRELLASRGITIPEGAEEDYPTPERRPITQTPLPDTEAIQAEIDAEFAAYEAEHGPLEPVELNWDLLIFGPAGYGPPD